MVLATVIFTFYNMGSTMFNQKQQQQKNQFVDSANIDGSKKH